MNIYTQCKYLMGFIAVLFFSLIMTGIALPIIVSSKLPLAFIVLMTIIIILGLPLCLYLYSQLLVLKKTIKPKGKRHASKKHKT